tara:strand:+ start:3105 stop:3434 length:330 start_codon:yes stop_codon:yes gene_type:complete
MKMDGMTQQVMVDLFTNTPFVGFLIWQYVQMRKDFKEQQAKMDELRKESLERQEAVRERFEKVIQGLNQDKDQLVVSLEKRIGIVENKLSTLEGQIKKLFSLIRELVKK